VNGALALSALVSGIGFPETAVSGRVIVTVRDGKVAVTAKGKDVLAAQPLAPDAKGVLHLENGKFGHVLVFKPVK
jgi:hypothetical protein